MAPKKQKAVPVPEHIAMADDTPEDMALEQPIDAQAGEPSFSTTKLSDGASAGPFNEAENIGLTVFEHFDDFPEEKLKDRFASIATRLASIDSRDGAQESAWNIAVNIRRVWDFVQKDQKKEALEAILGHLHTSRDLKEAIDRPGDNYVVNKDNQKQVTSPSADQTAERNSTAANWGGGDDGFFDRFEAVHHCGDNAEEDDAGEEAEDGDGRESL